jgi:hypothetical protein
MMRMLDRCLCGLRIAYVAGETTGVADLAHMVRFDLGTGFLVELERCVVVATAGHVLAKLRKATEAPNRLIRLDLDFRHPLTNSPPVTLYRDQLIPIIEDSEPQAIDHGALLLPPRALEQVRAAGGVPLEPAIWKDIPVPAPDIYFALGFPSEYRGTAGPEVSAGRVGFTTSWARLILPLSLYPDSYQAHEGERRTFRAKFGNLATGQFLIESLNGMSGGPVLAAQQTGDCVQISLIGIQSAWNKHAKTVTACFAMPFLRRIELQMQSG